MTEWTRLPILELLDGQWPGEWGSEPQPGSSPVVVYRSTELDDAGHLHERGGVYRSILPTKLNAKKLIAGDILVEASGGAPDRPVGRAALFSGLRDEPAIGANFLRTLRPKKTVCGSFLRWSLVALQQQPAIWRYQQQTTGMINLKVRDYLNHRIDVPPLPQQRRIAEILSTVDEAIEQTEALIAKYQQIKAGLMHDLFTRGITPDGHLRPTSAQAPHLYKESPLGWIPKEWEVKRLGVILKECGGYFQTGPFGSQLHAYEYQHEGVPVVMPQDINDGIVSTEQIARISERRAEDLSRHRMKTGDIVIARRGDLSRASVITDREETWLCGTGCFLLRLGRSSLHGNFAALVYRHDVVQRQIAGMAVGTTMPSLNNNVMERLLFPYCDPNEQSRITERIGSLDQSLRLAQRHLANSTQVKQGLMHDLLTGCVRVKVAEAVSI